MTGVQTCALPIYEIEDFITGKTPDDKPRLTGANVGHRLTHLTVAKDYRNHLLQAAAVDLTGTKIAIDCANGAAYAIAPELFTMAGAEVVAMSCAPDGININEKCGSTHMDRLCQLVTDEQCDIGFAFDGDADRMLAVDENGKIIDGDVIMAIMARSMKNQGTLKHNTIVATVMSNMGLDIFAAKQGIKTEKTAVGDRYVLENMQKNGYNFGGEQSGHIILLDHSTTGDGMLSALWLLKALHDAGQTLSQAATVMTVLPQVLNSVYVPNENKKAAMADEALNAMYKQKQQILDGKGRVLVRASGTEPVIRVMLEGEDLVAITAMAEELAAAIVDKYGK